MPASNPPPTTPAPIPAQDSVAGEEDPGAAIDAPAPPPQRNAADKAAERSADAAPHNRSHSPDPR